MEKAVADDALSKFEYANSDLDKSKFIQVSSDRSNVSLKFLDLLNEKRREKDLKELISVGVCGLHTVSKAFLNAEQSTDWNVKEVLMAMHKFF